MFAQEQTVCKLAEVEFRVGSPLHFLVHLSVFHGQTSAKSSDRDCTNLRKFYNIQMLESKEQNKSEFQSAQTKWSLNLLVLVPTNIQKAVIYSSLELQRTLEYLPTPSICIV